MIIKSTLVHSGWSYGKGDDQYDNVSIGSTKLAEVFEKSRRNSRRNDKKTHHTAKDSNTTTKHTDEQGWTTIETNSNRKPKTNSSNNSTIDSIISSINIEFTTGKKGAQEVNINSPIRENRCTIPDKVTKPNAIEFKPTSSRQQQQLSPPIVEATNDHTKDHTVMADTPKLKMNTQDTKIVTAYEDERGEKAQDNKKDTKNLQEEHLHAPSVSETGRNKDHGETKMALNGSSEVNQIDNNDRTNKEGTTDKNNNNDGNADKNTNRTNNNMTNNNNDKSNTNNNNGGHNNKNRVNILEPADMNTYTFTVSWRPDQKIGQDGKVIIRMLMREMAHRTPSIIFHPTNDASSPVPRDIHNINNDFPKTPANFDDFFDQMRNRDNTNQRTFMKVTMPHDEKELQKKLMNYLFYNKIYMNSPFIDDNTLEQVGFIENGHSRLVYRPTLETKIRNGLRIVMESESLSPQQVAQLKNLSSPIRVECHRGVIRAGPHQNQIVCEGIVLKTAKSQSKIVMELLSMLPETLLGDHYRVIPKSLGQLLGYELFGRIVADTVHFQNKLRPITIMHCHPSVFTDKYDSVKLSTSTHVKVDKFIRDCCGAISIEETAETQVKGKYIVVVPEDKVDSARIAIGTMFQEFQQSSGRPAATACISAFQNYPLVNDSVTISGHAQRLSEKIRERYRTRPKTPTINKCSSASYSYHGSTTRTNNPSQLLPSPAPVPRSIVKNGNQNNSTPVQQWAVSPLRQPEERTVMSNLSPDDSAKTMMTNVSRMVESLGTVVNTLAKENSNMAQATANTNESIKLMMMQQSENMQQQTETNKQMMIQQTTTMNNFMLLMTRNEERRQEVPIREIQQASTPTNSTLTYSQQSMSQQSSNKRNRPGSTNEDDDTTAASTTLTNTKEQETEEDDIDTMLLEREETIEELQMDIQHKTPMIDTTMTDNETENKEITTPIAAGNFEHQMNNFDQRTDNTDTDIEIPGTDPPITGVNRQ